MIANITNNTTTSLVAILSYFNSCPFEFYLTGSQFFGGATKESDIDFFVEDTPAVEEYLRHLWFQELEISGYKSDRTISRVFELHLEKSIGKTIQVQLIRKEAMRHKVRAQELISEILSIRRCESFTKRQMKFIWEMAVKAVGKSA